MGDIEQSKKNELSETRYKALLIRSLEIAENEFGTDMPVSSLILMLKLDRNSPTPMSHIIKTSKLSGAGVSRTVSTFAGYEKVNRRVIEKPYLLITEDRGDRRYKNVEQTDYCKKVINRLIGVIYDV